MTRWLALIMAVAAVAPAGLAADTLGVGSKRFTESYILAEIMTQTARSAGVSALHKPGMGNTGILFAALKSGAIDVYPEYTGTIALELLNSKEGMDLQSINRALAPLGLGAAVPLGFNNTYALAMLEAQAERLQVRSIADLGRVAGMKLGLSQEFLNRQDGWPLIKRVYGLSASPVGLDHGLAYEALAAGQIDVMDIYSTDAKQTRYRLRVLADERQVFPRYEAVLLHRLDLPQRFPKAWSALQKLAGRIPAERMVALNAAAELDGKPFAAVAREFLSGTDGRLAQANARASFLQLLFGADFWRLTGQHLLLVFISLAGGVLVAVPLGIWSAKDARVARVALPAVGVVQTIPSLALLAFLITLMGSIGTAPALVALFLYSLLPIVRNTASGLQDIPAALQESARALGLPRLARLRLIELPLAARSIVAGVKTSAVINVGTATIAAFIGAGGYGERIASGLALNDNNMLLAGALPAAALALLVEGAFGLAERRLISPGLRDPAPTASV